MNELIKADSHPIKFNDEEVSLISRTLAPDLTKNELQFFLYVASKTGLNPLFKQIHAVKRAGKVTFQVGIDGYRLIADRTGECAGCDDAIFKYAEDDKERRIPLSATVNVYRIIKGQKCSFGATAFWAEYFPQDEKSQWMWKKMPHGQLAKCAEALARRKAFPAELSGIYTDDEMDQAGNPVIVIPSESLPDKIPGDQPVELVAPDPEEEFPEAMEEDEIPFIPNPPPVDGRPISPGQKRMIHVMAKKVFGSTDADLSKGMFKDWLKENIGRDSVSGMYLVEAKRAIELLVEIDKKRQERGK